jgi:hypothetical protein
MLGLRARTDTIPGNSLDYKDTVRSVSGKIIHPKNGIKKSNF